MDVRSTRGENKKIPLQCVSAARAGLLLRRDHQEHLKRAVRECGFRYLRFHGLFQKDLGVYRETADGEAVYSWLYADQVLSLIHISLQRPQPDPPGIRQGLRTDGGKRAGSRRPNHRYNCEFDKGGAA